LTNGIFVSVRLFLNVDSTCFIYKKYIDIEGITEAVAIGVSNDELPPFVYAQEGRGLDYGGFVKPGFLLQIKGKVFLKPHIPAGLSILIFR